MTIIATGGWTFRAGKPWRYKADDEPEDMYANVNLATASLLAEVMRLREALTMIVKRDDWTSGECRHYARAVIDAACAPPPAAPKEATP